MLSLDSHTLKKLLEAIDVLHSHGHGLLHERLFRAMSLLYEGSACAFEMYGRDGTHFMWDNLPLSHDQKVVINQRLVEVVPWEHPAYELMLNGETAPIRISDLISLRQLKRTNLYNDIFKSVDGGRQLILPLHGFSGVGGISMNRSGVDYSDREVQIGALLVPHISRAHEVDQLISRLQPKIQGPTQVDFTKMRRFGFTRRECEVFCWIAEGKRDGEISMILSISVRTVNQHVTNILRKLKVETRTAAVAAMVNLGAISAIKIRDVK